MKTSDLVKRMLWAAIAVTILTWTACYPPEFRDIEQPGSAEYNDTFGVDISVLKLQSEYGPDSIFSHIGMALPAEWSAMLENRGSTNYRLVFGIMLPEGWSVADNIPFTGDDEGIFSYSDSLTQHMTGYYPPDTGYYWWVSETPETMNVSMGVIYFTPVITTDTSRGNFYLDYSLGYRDGDYLEIQASTSFNHLITVGLPDTVHVTTVAESGPGSIRAAIDSVSQDGTILFDLLFPATIVLSSPVEIYKSVNITGPSNGSLSFSGNDSCTVFNVPDYKRLGLSHVKVTDGNSYQGGGIVLGWHSEGILSDVEIAGNYSENSGAGIYAYSADMLYMENVVVSGNISEQGHGGGVCLYYTGFEISNTTFTDNQAYDYGGAICIYGLAGSSILSGLDVAGNQAGNGGGIYLYQEGENSTFEFDLENSSIHDNYASNFGGGISLTFNGNLNADFTGLDIYSNQASGYGGGIYVEEQSSGLLNLSGVTIRNNQAGNGGGIGTGGSAPNISLDPVNRCSIYNNEAEYGYDLYGIATGMQPLTLDTFSVICPNDYYYYPTNDILGYDIQHAVIQQIDHDIYVSPEGSDNNDGLSPGSPFRTLTHALERIQPDPGDPNTIFLASGTYDEMEKSPFYLSPFIHIQGTGPENCMTGYFNSYFDQGASMEGLAFNYLTSENSILSVQNFFAESINSYNSSCAFSDGHINGGSYSDALDANESEITCNNLSIASHYVGIYGYRSIISLNNCMIENNQERGIVAYDSTELHLSGTTIRYNGSSNNGGGIFLSLSNAVFDPDNRCNIYDNQAAAGCDLFIETGDEYYPYLNVIVDTFSVLQPTELFAHPRSYYSFDILHGKTEQVTADLYFSPEGSDQNSGLTPDDPLRSITQGMRKYLANNEQHTFFIGPGTYSEALTGEHFPLQLPGYITLEGAGKEITKILGSSQYGNLITFYDSYHDTIRNLTIDGGSIYGSTTGMVLDNDNVYLKNISVRNNSYGIYMTNTCGFSTDSVTIENNRTGITCQEAITAFDGLTITGNAPGIYISGGEVDLENLEIYDNDLGISATSSQLYIRHCNILGNHDGGGYFENCSGLFLGNSWKNNFTSYNAGGFGLYSCDMITFIDEDIVNNSAVDDGGGIYSQYSSTVFAGCRITGNSSADAGGGICFNYYSEFCLVDCMVEGNSAVKGGGFYDYGENGYLSGTTIRNNYATDGGGIYYHNSYIDEGYEWDEASRCNIYLNRALNDGNDLYSLSETIVHPVVVDTFTTTTPTDDFTWHTANFDLDILNGKLVLGNYDFYVSPEGDDRNSGLSPDEPMKTLANVSAYFAVDTLLPHIVHLDEGVYSHSATGETFPVEVTDNLEIIGSGRETAILDAEDNANLFITLDGYTERLCLRHLTLRNGSAESPNPGGAIYASCPELKLEDVTIEDCRASEGGAIYAKNAHLYFSNVLLTSNYSNTLGGAMYTSECVMNLKNTELSQNHANWYGGGWYARGLAVLKGENVIFKQNNTSEDSYCKGGALMIDMATGRLEGLMLEDNFSSLGGAILISQSDVDLCNITLKENEALKEGGGLFTNSSSVGISFASFSGNTAPKGSGMSIAYNSAFTFSHSIIPDNDEGRINLRNSGIDVLYSDITGGESAFTYEGSSTVNWLEGNIDADPLFEGSGDYPLALSAGSPCIDAGNPDTTGMGMPFWDLAGNNRLWDGDADGDTIADMGAFEFGSIGVGEEEIIVQSEKFKVKSYPNPFSDFTIIEFELDQESWINLAVYDQLGMQVAVLANELHAAGRKTFLWESRDLSAGIYFYRLNIQGLKVSLSGKMVKM